MNDAVFDMVTISREEYEELLRAKQELSELKRVFFGNTSERYIPDPKQNGQMSLFDFNSTLSEVSSVEASTQEPVEEIKVSYVRHKTSKKPKRKSLPAHLPRKTQTIEPANLCEGAEKIGEEISERYEYTPGKLYIRQTIRPKYVQPKTLDMSRKIVTAPMPAHPFPKSNLGISLAAHIAVSKYVNHLPLNRQIEIFSSANVAISPATINGWMTMTYKVLSPLYALLLNKVKASEYLQVDESTIKVIISKEEKKSRNKQNRRHTSYYWVAHSVGQQLVVFDYQNSRKALCAEALVGDSFQGLLQTDGYKAYDQLGEKEGVVHLACMAHVRRYFEKAHKASEAGAAYCMELIQQLYAVERTLKEKEITAVKAIEQYRQQHAKPLLDQWGKWLTAKKETLTNQKGNEGKLLTAINYTLARWEKVNAYLYQGKALIDNNAIENKIRPLALGRKNYLFAGSHQGAQIGAMFYSFFACCKMNKVNPTKWMQKALENICQIDANDERKLSELLPNRWHKIKNETGMTE